MTIEAGRSEAMRTEDQVRAIIRSLLDKPILNDWYVDEAVAALMRLMEPLCPSCNGSGYIVLGVHYVGRDMAMDAGEPAMEGQEIEERAPCGECAMREPPSTGVPIEEQIKILQVIAQSGFLTAEVNQMMRGFNAHHVARQVRAALETLRWVQANKRS